MIFGVGTDIVDIERIARSVERNGDKFAERILAPVEIELYQKTKNKINYLAKRFAAKEAVSKALGTGMRQGIDFAQLIISNDEIGKPQVNLESKALAWAEQNKITKIHLSISDEKKHAVAFAIAESHL
ncbi:holo-ACP synthase [Kangiella koreensis]|uniref:Holo-[acyl-carrier-protein] synthase n=1 Tax=Kangiella koreensis (strain DSM 16069 / JCM 12317 / KCTC 12182 / SW-125) TaxID=523791 RepID=C7RA60_KANKD|nr:holo-ACP synthase [Kangiella koreensis]ACV26179.1 holo-acyl-carrier-protein synthase [Kangiella koreensis DSM 16069]